MNHSQPPDKATPMAPAEQSSLLPDGAGGAYEIKDGVRVLVQAPTQPAAQRDKRKELKNGN